MAKESGMGDHLLIGGYDIGGDVQAVTKISGGPAALPATDITQFAMARFGGLRDGSIDFVNYMDIATAASHERLSLLPLTDTLLSYAHGYALGNPVASMVAKQINYDPSRPADGSLTFNVSAMANGFGLEWGKQLSAGKQTDVTGANGTSIDQTTVSTAFGWQAYMHVLGVTGTNLVVTLQDSADNSSFTNLTSGAFASATAGASPQWQRTTGATTTDTVRRYVRLVSSGTFSSATFLVQFVRNLTAVAF